jgi:hypothetical protein
MRTLGVDFRIEKRSPLSTFSTSKAQNQGLHRRMF